MVDKKDTVSVALKLETADLKRELDNTIKKLNSTKKVTDALQKSLVAIGKGSTEFAKLAKVINTIDTKSMESLAQVTKKYGTAVKESAAGSSKLKQQLTAVTKGVRSMQVSMAKLNRTNDEVNKLGEALGKLSAHTNNINKDAFRNMAKDVKEYRGEVTLAAQDTQKFNTKLTKVPSKLKKVTEEFKKIRPELSGLGTVVAESIKLGQLNQLNSSLKVGLDLGVTVGKDAFNEFASLEDRIVEAAGVSAGVSGDFDKAFSRIKDIVKTTAETTRFEMQDTSDSMLAFAQAGFQASDSARALPDVLRLASAGHIDAAKATDITIGLMKGFKIAVEDLSEANNVLVGTTTSSNTNITQLTNAINRAAPVASTYGVSLKETAAAMGVMGDRMLKSGKAGTGMIQILSRLAKTTPSVREAQEKLGTTLEVLQEEGFEGLVRAIERAREEMDPKEFVRLQNEAFGQRALVKMSVFADAGVGAFRRIREAQEAAIEQDLVLSLETKSLETAGAKFDILNSKIRSLVESIGASLAPTAISAFNSIGKAIDSIQASGLVEPLTKFAGALVLVGGATSGILSLAGLGSTLKILSTSLGSLGGVAPGVVTTLGKLGSAASLVAHTATLAGVALFTWEGLAWGLREAIEALEKKFNFTADSWMKNLSILGNAKSIFDLATDSSFDLGDAILNVTGLSNSFSSSMVNVHFEAKRLTKAHEEQQKVMNNLRSDLVEFLDKNLDYISVITEAQDSVSALTKYEKDNKLSILERSVAIRKIEGHIASLVIGQEGYLDVLDQQIEKEKEVQKEALKTAQVRLRALQAQSVSDAKNLIGDSSAKTKFGVSAEQQLIDQLGFTGINLTGGTTEFSEELFKKAIQEAKESGTTLHAQLVEYKNQGKISAKVLQAAQGFLAGITRLQKLGEEQKAILASLEKTRAIAAEKQGQLKAIQSRGADQIKQAENAGDLKKIEASLLRQIDDLQLDEAVSSKFKRKIEEAVAQRAIDLEKEAPKSSRRLGSSGKSDKGKEAAEGILNEYQAAMQGIYDENLDHIVTMDLMQQATEKATQALAKLAASEGVKKDATEDIEQTQKQFKEKVDTAEIKSIFSNLREGLKGVETGKQRDDLTALAKSELRELGLTQRTTDGLIDKVSKLAAETKLKDFNKEADKRVRVEQLADDFLEAVEKAIKEGGDIRGAVNKGEEKLKADLEKAGVSPIFSDGIAKKGKEKAEKALAAQAKKREEERAKQVKQAVEAFVSSVKEIGAAMNEFVGVLGTTVSTLSSAFLDAVGVLSSFSGFLGSNPLTDLFSSVSDSALNAGGALMEGGIGAITSTIQSALDAGVSLISNAATSAVGAVAAPLTGGVSLVMSTLLSAGTSLMSGLTEVFTNLQDFATESAQALVNFAQTVFQQTEAFERVESVMGNFVDQIATTMESLGPVLEPLFQVVAVLGGKLNGLLGSLINTFSGLGQGLLNFINNNEAAFNGLFVAVEMVGQAFMTILNTIPAETFSRLINTVASLFVTFATILADNVPLISVLLFSMLFSLDIFLRGIQILAENWQIVTFVLVSLFSQILAPIAGILLGIVALEFGVRLLVSGISFIVGIFTSGGELLAAGIDLMIQKALNVIGTNGDAVARAQTRYNRVFESNAAAQFAQDTITYQDDISPTKFLQDLFGSSETPDLASLNTLGSDLHMGLANGLEEGFKKGNEILNGPQGFRAALHRWRANATVAQESSSQVSQSLINGRKEANHLEGESKKWVIQNMQVVSNDPVDMQRKIEREAYRNGAPAFQSTPFHRG